MSKDKEKCGVVARFGCKCRLDKGHKEDHYGDCDYNHHWPKDPWYKRILKSLGNALGEAKFGD
jgi:hypothetical protein